MATKKHEKHKNWATRIPWFGVLAAHEKTRPTLVVMLWFLCFAAVWILGRGAIWLYSLNATIKNQRYMRIEMRVGDASQMTQLDGSELETLTRELQGLGFVHLGDIISKMDTRADAPSEVPAAPIADPNPQGTKPKMIAETTTNGVGRIFAHPNHGCYAHLVSVVAVSRFPPEMKRADMVNVAPFRTLMLTLSGNNDDSWGYSTHNREVQPFSLLLRHPRQLSRRMVGASAAQLLETHLAERDEIASKGDFKWDKAPTMEKYQQYEARGVRHIRAVYQRATTLGVAWQLFTFRFSKHEKWRGELAGR